MDKVKAPKLPKVRKPFVSEDHFRALLELCPLNTFTGARRQSVFWIFLTSGIRRDELLSLKIDDLQWENSTIRVIFGKGQKERQVPFHREAQRAVLRYLQHRQVDLPWLWVTSSGKRLTREGLTSDFRRFYERAGIRKDMKDAFHIFRRTWAANSVRQGIPSPYTQAVAGWSTAEMLDQYVRAMEAEEGAIEAYKDFDPFGGKKNGKGRG